MSEFVWRSQICSARLSLELFSPPLLKAGVHYRASCGGEMGSWMTLDRGAFLTKSGSQNYGPKSETSLCFISAMSEERQNCWKENVRRMRTSAGVKRLFWLDKLVKSDKLGKTTKLIIKLALKMIEGTHKVMLAQDMYMSGLKLRKFLRCFDMGMFLGANSGSSPPISLFGETSFWHSFIEKLTMGCSHMHM